MTQDTAPDTAVAQEAGFDLLGTETLSFALLTSGRAQVFVNHARLDSFRRTVEGLPTSGEQGRRKGLGLWMLGQYEAAAKQLAAFASDDVASFTRAKALQALGRAAEAQPLFERLSGSYPSEPRPRSGALETRFEAQLLKDGEAAALELERALAASAGNFAQSAEGHYLAGRAAEQLRRYEEALGHYETTALLDPTHRTALFRGAFLAERCGLDELAISLYERLVEQRPTDLAVLMNLGMLYEDVGRDAQAAACYDLGRRQFPADELVRLYLLDARSAVTMYYDEDQERKEDRLNQILRIPITDFELSVRARNCLNKMNINTLGDLVCRNEQELLSYKNFGETSLNEIKEILQSKGLRLGMTREEAVSSVETVVRRTPVPEKTDASSKPIAELQLSIRARRTVEALGCMTVADVLKHSEQELLGMPNFGATSLQELKAKLTEINLKLRE